MRLTKQYIDVQWKHQNPDDPVGLLSELGDDRFDLRKLEFSQTERPMSQMPPMKPHVELV